MLHPLGPSSAQTQILSQHRASFVSFRGPDDNPDFKYVQLLVEISKIGEIDTLNERYQAEFYIEAKWIGENDIVEYDPKRHWNPKLYVENTYQEPKETLKYDVSRDKNNNTIVTEVRHIKGLFWERLELQNFPVVKLFLFFRFLTYANKENFEKFEKIPHLFRMFKSLALRSRHV